jgi:uncharacterized protein (TIGR02646 family)
MAQFSRESQPFTFTSPRQYKPFLRSDFRTRCAYCERPEEYLGGEEAFEVEHFRPKSKFPQLDCVYSNLYYACRGCNAHKSETWPSEELAAHGSRFADPCQEDPYKEHLAEDADGGVTGTTPCGIYTTAHIRLHRESVKEWRRLRAQALIDLPVCTGVIGLLERLRAGAANSEREQLEAHITWLKDYIEEAKSRFRIA